VLFYEFCGTAFTVLAFTTSIGDSMARALAYFILFVLFFNVTGAHFNPATSFADYLYHQNSGKYPHAVDRKNAFKLLLVTILVQILGALLGLLFTYLLVKYYLATYQLYPVNNLDGLYMYIDNLGEIGFQYARIFGQEVLQTCLFTLFYLALTQGKDKYTTKSNFLLKGLALAYILNICYEFSFKAGACLNPALGFAESIYQIAYDNNTGAANVRSQCIWVYMIAPFVGAMIAAALFKSHQEITLEVEKEEDDFHTRKMNESRSVDKIDVEDTRSIQSTLYTE